MIYELYDLTKEEKISLIKRNRSSLSEGLDSSSVTITKHRSKWGQVFIFDISY